MTKLLTLRNIIALFIVLSFTGCTKVGFENSSTIGEVKSYSSEDKNDIATIVGEIRDRETGQVICVVKHQ